MSSTMVALPQIQKESLRRRVSYALADHPKACLPHSLSHLRQDTVEVLEPRTLFSTIAVLGESADYVTGSHPWQVAAADLNADGSNDLVVANPGSDSFSVFLNDGTGRFPQRTDYPGASATLADFNGDKSIDVSVGGMVEVNAGDGTFPTQISNPGLGGNFFGVGDFDGNGTMDLASTFNGYDRRGYAVRLNDGNGNFGDPIIIRSVTHLLRSIAAGDFNGDGFDDLAVANSGTSSDPYRTIIVALSLGGGKFSEIEYNVGISPFDVTTGDFDGDGSLDIAVTRSADEKPRTLAILRNRGDGTFEQPLDFGVGGGHVITTADFDGDGRLDLAVRSSSITKFFVNAGGCIFVEAGSVATGPQPLGMVTVDLDGDNVPDLVTTNYEADTIAVHMDIRSHLVIPEPSPEVRGTADNDEIAVSRVTVLVGGESVTSVQVTVNGIAGEAFIPWGPLEIEGLAGHDTITIDPAVTIPVVIYGGDGNDTITAGSGNSSLYGGTGDDRLVGRGGNNLIEGGEGADTLVGGDGADTLYGHDGNDSMLGNGGDDELYGNDGNDTLAGGTGNDYLAGNDDHDSLLGDAGNDTLHGNFGSDTLSGGSDDDHIFGGIGRDVISGSIGDDTLLGGNGMDLVYGGPGHDHIEGKGKADTLHGGIGNDTLVSGAGADLVLGEDGDDILYANPHVLFHDTLSGGAGHDRYQADEDDILATVEEPLLA